MQQPGPELVALGINLQQTDRNLKEVRSFIKDLQDKIKAVGRAVDTVDTIEDTADSFGNTVSKLQLTLKLMDKAGPLKVLAKIGADILLSVERVAKRVEDKADDPGKRIDKSGIEDDLKDWKDRLENYDKKLGSAEDKVGYVLQATGYAPQVLDALHTYEIGDGGVGTRAAFELWSTPINDVAVPINNDYAAIRQVVLDVRNAVPDAQFNPALSVRISLDKIDGSLAFLRKPLNEIAKVLKPVEGLLDAVGFIFNITVGPIINWMMESLGINRIINSVAEKITALLPNPLALDPVGPVGLSFRQGLFAGAVCRGYLQGLPAGTSLRGFAQRL